MYVQEQMIPEQEQETFVEACSWHVEARYGETRPKRKFVPLSDKYSREDEGDVSRNRKCRAKKKYLYKRSAVAMWKLSSEEWKSARTSSGIHREKKSSRLLKVGKRWIDSSDSESFDVLETKPKYKFSVEDDSSVIMGDGEEDDDA